MTHIMCICSHSHTQSKDGWLGRKKKNTRLQCRTTCLVASYLKALHPWRGSVTLLLKWMTWLNSKTDQTPFPSAEHFDSSESGLLGLLTRWLGILVSWFTATCLFEHVTRWRRDKTPGSAGVKIPCDPSNIGIYKCLSVIFRQFPWGQSEHNYCPF